MRNTLATRALLAVIATCAAQAQTPLASEWTYQGSLSSNGNAVDGTADFEFRLFDALAGGNAVGAIVARDNVAVAGGLFTVRLDFGVEVFNGQARWLSIAVRSPHDPTDTQPFSPLNPRQPLTATPYALQTRGLFVNSALQVGVGTTAPTARLHLAGGDLRIDGGNELHMFNGLATDVETVTLDGQFNNGGLLRLRNSGSTSTVELRSEVGNGEARGGVIGDLGVGILTPTARLHVRTALDDARPSVRVETLESAIGTHTATLELDSNAMDAFFDGLPSNLRLNPNSSGHVLLGVGGGSVGVNEVLPDAKLHVSGSSNASASGGGIVVIEHEPSGNQLVFDGNELLARSGGAAIPLHLNAGGGDVTLAQNGAGNVGIGTDTPRGTLHVRTSGVGVTAANAPGVDVVVEDADAKLGLYSTDAGTGGSALTLAETGGGVFQDQWAILRETSAVGDTLFFTFGTDPQPFNNQNIMALETNGSVFIPGQLETSALNVNGRADARYTTITGPDILGYEFRVNDDAIIGGDLLIVNDLDVNGDFQAFGTKNFRIDDPRDPANRYLRHYCHEGPEPQNVYNGVVSLDAGGEATVELPSYFQSINRDSRYFLTPIGAAMPNLHVAQTIEPGAEPAVFRVAGGAPGKQVSWEVKAIRNDPYMRAHGISVEVEKQGAERGRYLAPELYGQPRELRVRGSELE